jgi:hypothetical protein
MNSFFAFLQKTYILQFYQIYYNTEMNNSDQYRELFGKIVEGRNLFLGVQRMSIDNTAYMVEFNLLNSQTGLSWDNEADRIRIVTYEVRCIIHLLRGIERFDVTDDDMEQADILINELNNTLNKYINSLNQR